MSESIPITTPPKRRDNNNGPRHPSNMYSGTITTSDSCKTTPNPTRRLEAHHHALLESGSQSAKSSPLPHRRLDKLEGVIRDKASPLSLRRRLESDDSSSAEQSPCVGRKFNSHTNMCRCHCDQQPKTVGQCCQNMNRRNTDCQCRKCSEQMNAPIDSPMRRRVESDCSCSRKSRSINGSSGCSDNHGQRNNTSDCHRYKKESQIMCSPAKGTLGEPGVFSSPIHRPSHVDNLSHAGNFSMYGSGASPAKSAIGEPGVFASPARSPCSGGADDDLTTEVPHYPDQTIVSGWLKFRDNKRVSRINFIIFLIASL